MPLSPPTGGGMPPNWQPLAEADLGRVADIAAELHPTLHERTEVLAEKLRLFPTGCRKLQREGRLLGYALSHPWLGDEPPALDRFLRQLPARSEYLFIHDVAILPEARGQGAAAAFLQYAAVVARANGLAALTLIAVYGSERLWQRFGFARAATTPAAGSIGGYGRNVRYLRCDLPGDR